MQTFIRRLHLFTSLVLVVWVVMYFVTGWIIVHESRFPRGEPQRTTRTEPLQFAGERNSGEFVGFLESRFGVHGRRQPPKAQKDGTWLFRWVRPGVNHDIVVNAAGTQATVTRAEFGATGLAHGLHRLHGYGGGAVYDIWSVFYDLASCAMIVFAVTGIYLWWRTAKVKWPGWLCLAFSFGFTGTMIGYWMLSR
jgi:hypothetical protein